MHDESPPEFRLRIMALVGSCLILVGVVWSLVVLIGGSGSATAVVSGERIVPPSATAQSRTPLSFGTPVLFDMDLGTGSTEFSAVTINGLLNRLVIADDEGQLFEFDIKADGLPISPPRRMLSIDVGDTDIEGLAWLGDTTYALAHESDGRVSIVDVDEGITMVGPSHVRRTIETGIAEIDGNGIEGVSPVAANGDHEFVVVVERPPGLHFIGTDGAVGRFMPLDIGVSDVSDIWASPDGTFWVVSDESRVLVRVDIEDGGAITQLQQLDLVLAQGRFEQPEGVVMSPDGTHLYVVGEALGPGRFSVGVWPVLPSS